MVAALIVYMVPGVGWVFVPVILIVGHLFNLVINALGSFIHSGRLQYVEFFSKFSMEVERPLGHLNGGKEEHNGNRLVQFRLMKVVL